MTIDAYKKEIQKEFARVRKLTSSSSHWMKEKTDKVWLCEYVGKLKGVGKLAKEKMDELSIHTIADLQLHDHHHGIPKVLIRGFGRIYDIALQALPGKPPSYLKDHKKAKNPSLSIP